VPSGRRRSEECGSPLALAFLGSGQAQSGVAPPVRQVALNRLPLVDEAHEPEYKACACDADQRGVGGFAAGAV
jgi:hypothetical protein